MTPTRIFRQTATATAVAACVLAAACSGEAPPPAPSAVQTPPPAAAPTPVIPPPAAPDPEQAMSESLASLGALETPRGYSVRLASAKFASGSTAFEPADPSRIEQIAGVLEQHPQMHALIEGFTDSRGNEKTNEALSQKRAEAARQALIDRGIDESRLRARGAGEARPIADNSTQEGREQNRRVEILFSNTEGRFAAAADTPPSG